ncbi:MAG: HpaII family restriction endonuclease [Clostridiales bacterium]|nr:HpaII family restriction endonuclease [Clostridiales bacterium]
MKSYGCDLEFVDTAKETARRNIVLFGGYIVLKGNGEIVAYHTYIADEFKNFLLNKLGFETPGAKRHKFMQIYKKIMNIL